MFDIVESRRAAAEKPELLEQVGREHTLLEAVLRHPPAGVLIVEAPSGHVLFHNGRLAEILSRST